MKVIFNADDYGLTTGVTNGIIKAHVDGVVNSATLMMNGKAVNYAIEQAKKTPSLKVGIHLVLTYGKPVSDQVPALIDADGKFKFKNTTTSLDDNELEQIEKEWRAQLDAFLATGLTLNHIDSHHHVHGLPALKDLVVKLAADYQVPVRYAETLKDEKHLLYAEQLWVDFYQDGVSEEIFDQLKALDVDSVEIMTHPAIVDAELKELSSYLLDREKELEILCKIDVPDWVEK
ncbi:chitin disaccharide deacetylase [Paraliobacillus salinarum]|uniref:chitin disaccharide deacetylase n=1 Tax=Paraliobacillus salinarum TaxID=1158996 RepID=UPI0015F4D248|nr:chitin disaccharide deacetylase [Paraliobacillus salinarum]